MRVKNKSFIYSPESGFRGNSDKEINTNLKKGLPIFIKKALPLTIITIFGYIFALYILNNYNELSESIYKVIFIGLASLTFPHILLEYLIEKNE